MTSANLNKQQNTKLTHQIPNLNCSELISQELGVINSSKVLIGLLPVFSDPKVTKATLYLYFMKKTLHGADGSTDLVTVVTLVQQDVNRTLVLSVLKKIMDKYFEFREDLAKAASSVPDSTVATRDTGGPCSPQFQSEELARAKLGEFKLYMTQIILFEELQCETNRRMYSYGSNSEPYWDQEPGDIITPNSLVSATEEVAEVRELMLDNISKVLNRGDKINSLVSQTERLQSSSAVFLKNALAVKRLMRWANYKFFAILGVVGLLLLYLFISTKCGFPFLQECVS